MKLEWVATLDDLISIANEIMCNQNSILLFHGSLGSGKTTLIKTMCKAIGTSNQVTSPTFAIVHEYAAQKKIFHFDLYRIKSIQELEEIGFEEYLNQDAWVFIEWPEIATSVLENYSTTSIQINVDENQKRIITLEA